MAPQDYDDADAAYKQALANAQTAADQPRLHRITAPISGRIGRSPVTKARWSPPTRPTALATIQRLDPIYVDITQSSARAAEAQARAAGGQLTSGGPADAPRRR